MKFRNTTSDKTLLIDLGDGARVVDPGDVTEVPERYAYVVALRGYPLEPVVDAPEPDTDEAKTSASKGPDGKFTKKK